MKLISNNFLLVLCIAFVSIASGQTIPGKVTDAATGEPLVGATVSLEHTKFNTVSNLDGSYLFKNVPAGKYEVKVKYSGSKYSYTPCVAYNGAAAVQAVDPRFYGYSLPVTDGYTLQDITGISDLNSP